MCFRMTPHPVPYVVRLSLPGTCFRMSIAVEPVFFRLDKDDYVVTVPPAICKAERFRRVCIYLHLPTLTGAGHGYQVSMSSSHLFEG